MSVAIFPGCVRVGSRKIPEQTIAEEEVWAAWKMDASKAAETERIHQAMVRLLVEVQVKIYLSPLLHFGRWGLPADWSTWTFVPVYKGGDRDNYASY